MSNTVWAASAFVPQQEARDAQQGAREAQAQANAAQGQAREAQREAQAQANAAQAQARETQREVQEQIRAAMQAAKEAAVAAQKEAEATAQLQGIGRPQAPQAPGGPYTSGSGSPYGEKSIPPQVVDIMAILGITLVCCVVGLPVARAFARWIDRRSSSPTIPREVTSRLESIEEAVESVAVEVERISEGQRFTTRMLNERTHEPAHSFAAERELVPVSAPAPAPPNTPANSRRS